ncbi:hypothetical protein CI601_08280 [Bifidobacterium sp. wkB344]|nr:hypothetical protein CI601_08280 [Bifidobacterium sp. wkB344]
MTLGMSPQPPHTSNYGDSGHPLIVQLIDRSGGINNQRLPLTVGVLPTAEGENIGVAMIIGLLAMSIMAANLSSRNSITAITSTKTSHE